jgi:chitinase
MTYDDYGFYSKINKTKHHSAFEYSTDILEFYHNKGVSREKLLIGVPFYGRSFTLINASDNGIGSPIEPLNPITGAPTKDFVVICQNVKNGNWAKGYGNNSDDPYAYHDTFWVGYDDPFQAFTYDFPLF